MLWRGSFRGIAIAGVFISLFMLCPSAGTAALSNPDFYRPIEGACFKTGDVVQIRLNIDYSCSYDLSRPFFLYLWHRGPDGFEFGTDDINDGEPVFLKRVTSSIAKLSYDHRIHMPPDAGANRYDCWVLISIDEPVGPHHPYFNLGSLPFVVTYYAKPSEPIPDQPLPTSKRPYAAAELAPPWPNPFNPQTTIKFSLQEPGAVSLKVYDVNGTVVKTFYRNQFMQAGEFTENWNGRNDLGQVVSSGIYFLRFDAAGRSQTRKLILMR